MKLKKIFVVALATVLYLASSVSVFAAGISTEEQAILDVFKAGIELNGVVVQVPSYLINQVENEFLKNDPDITADQATFIIEKLDEFIAYAQAANFTTLEDLKASFIELLPIIQEAATTAGYTIGFDDAESDITVVDEDGKTVFTSKEVINQTGFDLTTTALVGSLLVTVLAACILVANKKKLFVKELEA